MTIKEERKKEIYNLIAGSDVVMTRRDIAGELGFNNSSPYLIELLRTLVEEGAIEEVPCIATRNGKKRNAWGYIKSVN